MWASPWAQATWWNHRVPDFVNFPLSQPRGHHKSPLVDYISPSKAAFGSSSLE